MLSICSDSRVVNLRLWDMIFKSGRDDWDVRVHDNGVVFMYHLDTTDTYWFFTARDTVVLRGCVGGNNLVVAVFGFEDYFCGKLLSMFPEALWVFQR